MELAEVSAQLGELRAILDSQQAELDRVGALLPAGASDEGPASRAVRSRSGTSGPGSPGNSRRSLLKNASLTAIGASAGMLATGAGRAAATTTIGDNLVVTGSSTPATASQIGSGEEALTIHGSPDGVEVGSKTSTRIRVGTQTSWDSDDDHLTGSNLDINKPAAVFRQTGEDHKGAMVEFQQYFDAGPHEYGIATNTPGSTFSIDAPGYRRIAWILAHYDSPNPVDGVHQHLNFETCKADLETIITRFQISWGEDIALCSFPNSNVRIIQSNKTLSFGGGNQVRAVYDQPMGKLAFSGDPVNFEMGQLQVGDNWVSPTYFVRKPTDQTRSNSTVLQDDAHLVVPVVPNATYVFTAFVAYRADPNADLKVAWSVPSGASLLWTPDGPGIITTGIVGPSKQSANGTDPVNLGGAGTGMKMVFAATGILRTAAEWGSIQLRWAQDKAHSSTTTICADSFVQLTRVE